MVDTPTEMSPPAVMVGVGTLAVIVMAAGEAMAEPRTVGPGTAATPATTKVTTC